MASRTKPEDTGAETPPRAGYEEFAPSEVRGEEPTFARTVGFIGMVLAIPGAMFVFLNVARGRPTPTWGVIAFAFGLALLLFHAARDGEKQVRRSYGLFGAFWLVLGGLFALLPGGPERAMGYNFLPYGFTCLVIGLLFLMPFARHETDPAWRERTLLGILGLGAALSVGTFFTAAINPEFMVGPGILLNLLGLAFLCVYVPRAGAATGRGYQVAVGMGVLGAVAILYVLGRTVIPDLFGMRVSPFLVPTGLLMIAAGALYVLFSLAFASDNTFVVMTRKELVAYFYSPIAYLVLLAFSLLGGLSYWNFLSYLELASFQGGGLNEPIVRHYFISLWPVMAVAFVVPALTMRLLAEESRTGTMEVMFTAPVTEWSVVLSKFLAALVFFLFLWVPWGLYLVALRAENAEPFDYRPLLSFYVALAACGAGFVSMGLFFSSLTRNQIIAAVLTFFVMTFYVTCYFLYNDPPRDMSPLWRNVFGSLSFIDLWREALAGRLLVRDLILQLSLTFFWLFLTVKVLESRRWK